MPAVTNSVIPELSPSMFSKPLLKLKLLDSLRQGSFSQLKALLEGQQGFKEDSNAFEVTQLMLHYAVQVAPFNLIKEIVIHWANPYRADDDSINDGDLAKTRSIERLISLNINQQDHNGNTPLHIAAFQSRGDVVGFLMDQPNINDCITNNQHLQPLEMCKNLNVAQMMQIKRSRYVAEIAQEFRTAFNTRDFNFLESILSVPRNAELLDINGTDPETGDTVLHEFVKKRDLIMCKWLLEHGADPFKRDSKGNLPSDLVKRVKDPESAANTNLSIDVELQQVLENASKEQSVIEVTSGTHAAPTYKGYLQKWTNFAQGYKLRWFILSSDGKLSYYIDQADTKNACRGSLNLSTCALHLDSSEKLKFEIIGGSNGTIRWHLKGNHPIETNRWVWAIQGAIRYAKDREILVRSGTISNSLILSHNIQSNINPSNPLESPRTLQASSFHQTSELNETQLPIKRQPSISGGNSTSKSANTDPNADGSYNDQEQPLDNSLANFNEESGKGKSISQSTGTHQNNEIQVNFASEQKNIDVIDKFVGQESEDDDEYEDDNEATSLSYKEEDDENLKVVYGPYSQKLNMLQRSITIELSSLTELLSDRENMNVDGWMTVNKSLITMSECFEKLNSLTADRDKKMIAKLTKQRDVNNVWIQSVKELEMELVDKDERLSALDKERKNLKKLLHKKLSTNSTISDDKKLSAEYTNAQSSTLADIVKYIDATKDEDEDSDADEFFDAEELKEAQVSLEDDSESRISVEMNNTSNSIGAVERKTEVSSMTLTSTTDLAITPDQIQVNKVIVEQSSFEGYDYTPRKKLSIDLDNRPKVSLWSVLKSMVGRDLTKMTLPVSFNEPMSLLQRLAEDMEYSDLLDKAASFEDSTLRMLYLAGYTASSYASTISRVAKPFNPLLGETYEYTDPKRGYRFFTEQVSHHPPICATWIEHPKWNFWAEFDIESSFNGRTYAVKHLGLWCIKLRPDSGAPEELYSYRKPDNAVVGILVGKPLIDNNGDVKIINHQTGDYCKLNYKPHGWTSAGGFEVRGEVYNKKDEKVWVLGGHWNDAIYAKKVTSHDQAGIKLEYTKSSAANGASASVSQGPNYDGTKFLIWKANERPKVPFNLTNFAIGLNELNEKLQPWLPPTDSRFRPDQRAMEEGRYDEAADEKHRIEVKQRNKAKLREEQNVRYQPQWFEKDIHPVTNQPYWRFKGDYWKIRQERKLAECSPDIFSSEENK